MSDSSKEPQGSKEKGLINNVGDEPGKNKVASDSPDGRPGFWEKVSHDAKLGAVVAVFCCLLGAVLAYYPAQPTPPSNSTNISTQIVNNGFSKKEYIGKLNTTIERLRYERKQVKEIKSQKYKEIEAAIKNAEEKLLHPDRSYEETLEENARLAGKLDLLEGQMPEAKIAAAKEALAKLDSTKAKKLWQEFSEESAKRTAEGKYNYGLLAKEDLDYGAAMEAFETAVACERNNITYLLAAGNMAKTVGNYPQATIWLEKSLNIAENNPKTGQDTIQRCQNELGQVYLYCGNYKKALPLLTSAFNTCKKIYGEEHPYTATSYNNIAILYSMHGQYKRAELIYRKIIEIYIKEIGEKNSSTATAYNNLAESLKCQGHYELAIFNCKKALAIFKKYLGEEHPDTAASYNNLAELYRIKKKYDQAELNYKKALAICEKKLDEAHPLTATLYNNLGLLYEAQVKYELAEKNYQRALNIYQKTLGEMHPSTAASYNNLAGLFSRNENKLEQAESYYNKALTIYKEVLGEEHPDTALLHNNIAMLYDSQKKFGKALPYYVKSLNVLLTKLPSDHPTIQTVSENYLTCLQKMEKENIPISEEHRNKIPELKKLAGIE